MERFQYLVVLGACLLLTLPLELVLGARVYRRPGRLLRTLVPVVAVFFVWDAIAIARGHWSFRDSAVTGWRLPLEVPVEEVAFFVAIPLCVLLTFEASRRVLGR